MKIIRKTLVLSFVLILLTVVGCTGERNVNDNTTGGGIGADRTNLMTEDNNFNDRYSFDRDRNNYTTPYNTNYITNNMRTTGGGITGQNNDMGSAFTNR